MREFNDTAHALMQSWNALRAGGRLPDIGALDPVDFQTWRPHLSLDTLGEVDGRLVLYRDARPLFGVRQRGRRLRSNEEHVLCPYLRSERIGLPILSVDNPPGSDDKDAARLVMPMTGALEGERSVFMVWSSNPIPHCDPIAVKAPDLRVLDPRRGRIQAA